MAIAAGARSLVKRDTSPEPAAGQKKQPRGRPFQPGVSGNPAGRPKRDAHFMDKYRNRVEAQADSILDAHFRRLKSNQTVGERAFTNMRDTLFGLPVQKLQVESNQGMETLRAYLQAGGLAGYQLPPEIYGAVVDGTFTEQPEEQRQQEAE